ncbi:YdbC family protein [Oceanivirga salmonicida]|uniref:YdbC family protein n=1 Tax=Oceanivirga salmonicida TaxID=1769291 RepID=UPI0008357972|nr:PC4/YdbC family ssDNA-binding protein [Oceanivirga salmonicida]
MADFKFEIVENLGTISTTKAGWTREVNMVSWNGKPAKLDIRDWDPTHEKMAKGLTFTKEEIEKLKEILMNNLD